MGIAQFDFQKAARELSVKLQRAGIGAPEIAGQPIPALRLGQTLLEPTFIGMFFEKNGQHYSCLRIRTSINAPELTDIHAAYRECLSELYFEDSQKIARNELNEGSRKISVGMKCTYPAILVTEVYIFNETDFLRYNQFLDSFLERVNQITEGKLIEKQRAFEASHCGFKNTLHDVIQTCEREWNKLTNDSSIKSHYWGVRAVKKLAAYKEELNDVMSADEPLKKLSEIYKKVEKDFGRSSRAAVILMVAACAIVILTVAALMIAMPHLFALGMAAAFSIVGGGVIASIVGMVVGSMVAISKNIEAESFKNVLCSAEKNFPTLFTTPKPAVEETTPTITPAQLSV